MLTLALFGLGALVAAALFFVLAVLLLPASVQLPTVTVDGRDLPPLPQHRLTGADLRALRMPVTLRGYRCADVDLLLERLAAEMTERDGAEMTERDSAEPVAVAEIPTESAAVAETDDGAY